MTWKVGDIEATPKGKFQLTVQNGQYKWVPHTPKVMGALESIYSSDVPTLDPSGEIIKRSVGPGPSLGQQALGVGEAGLTALTGATGGALGFLGDAMKMDMRQALTEIMGIYEKQSKGFTDNYKSQAEKFFPGLDPKYILGADISFPDLMKGFGGIPNPPGYQGH